MSDMTPTRIAEIRSLAEKATPGPWEVEDEQNDGNFGGGPDCNSGYKSYAVVAGNKTVVDTLNSDLAEIEEDGDCEDGSWRYSRWDEVGRRNAAYIAALDPQTVLALLSRIEDLEGEVERLEKSLLEEIDNRDSREEWINRIYQAVVGDPPEWSNLFGFQEACNAIADAVATARTEAARKMRERCANDNGQFGVGA